MDKTTVRKAGIDYRSSLSPLVATTKSDQMCVQLRKLLAILPGPYLTYTSLLPGEMNPANAFINEHATFIKPVREAPMTYDDFSTIVIPMVAGDSNGNRVGMGGGWFDRFLSKHPDAHVIGICYDDMIVDAIHPEDYDIAVNYICTETKIITCAVE